MFLIQLLLLLCVTGQQGIPNDTAITLVRTVCFGTCPSYELSVLANGEVVFTGRRFVKKVGKVRSRITRDQLRQLISEFEKIDYFSPKESNIYVAVILSFDIG